MKNKHEKLHYHVLAGDHGYLPSYSEETVYSTKKEASESLTEYVKHIVNNVDDEMLKEADTTIDGVAKGFANQEGIVLKVLFNRKVAMIDYAEVSECDNDKECLTIEE
tara:strand:- start:8806 stop:9129 length:324 start_codon:yes stop_codon:yes gene_type:complete